MNQSLLKEIIVHIYANFAIIPSNFINLQKTNSLIDNLYLLKERLSFEIENVVYKGKIWGCQMNIGSQEIKVLLGDCSIEKEISEYAMIIQPKNSPIYGLYLAYNNEISNPNENLPMIAVSLDTGKKWMICNTGLQATFLAGMEQARELGMQWQECIDYDTLFKAMISFFKFHSESYLNR